MRVQKLLSLETKKFSFLRPISDHIKIGNSILARLRIMKISYLYGYGKTADYLKKTADYGKTADDLK